MKLSSKQSPQFSSLLLFSSNSDRDGEKWKIFFAGVVHITSIQGLFKVVDRGCCVVGYFIEEALEVGVVDCLDEVLE